MIPAFTSPHFLWLLPLALLPLIPRRRNARPLSSLQPVKSLAPSWRIRLWRLQPPLAALTLALLILLLAGPVQRHTTRTTIRAGVDLMLALDVSASLGAADIPPSRMAAARSAAADFLTSRKDDRIGVILFSGVPVLLSPPVLDKGALIARLQGVEADRSGSGTAIGDALAVSLARLKDSPARSKAVILLTDGSSNRGHVTPRAAARAAAALGIRVYTIGFGTAAGAEIPLGADGAPARLADGTLLLGALEEEPLQEMARISGGQYFRAGDAATLREIYHRIDALEKSPLETRDTFNDRPLSPALQLGVALLLLLELLLYRLWLRIVPASGAFDLAVGGALLLLVLPAQAPAQPPRSSNVALALTVDVSASMGVRDVTPSRLEQARQELRALVTGLPGARFSLTLCGGEGVIQTPLTEDHAALLFFIDRLTPGMVDSPGSAPEEGVLTALQTLSSATGGERAVILLTDGERTVATPPPRLPTTTPVYVVPLGTSTGGPVVDADTTPRRDRHGRPAISRLDRERLDLLATTTGGGLLQPRPGSFALVPLVERWRPPDIPQAPQAWSLWLALLLLTLAQAPWSRTRTAVIPFLPPLAGLGILLLAACNDSTPDNRAFAAGLKYAAEGAPADAAAAFARAAAVADESELGAALYNQGTALLAAGEAEAAVVALERSLLLLPGDTAVRTNLALALRILGDHPPSGSGDGDRRNEGEGDGPISRDQALQLIEAVKPQAFAASVANDPIRERRVTEDW